jgi:hypothetical protein
LGVYFSGKRNSSGRNEYEEEIRCHLVGWYGSGSGGIRGFRVLPRKNNFDWYFRGKVYLGQGLAPDYLCPGLINAKRPMRENRSACAVKKWAAEEVPLRPFFVFHLVSLFPVRVVHKGPS